MKKTKFDLISGSLTKKQLFYLLNQSIENNHNVVINMLGIEIQSLTIDLLKEFYSKFEQLNKSFILVSNNNLKEWGGVVIPTIQEAEDYIEMEEIQRKLKF